VRSRNQKVPCLTYESPLFDFILGRFQMLSILKTIKINKKTPWPQSANELYRPSDRRLSAKLVPTFFADRG
jgi:hypothetical protein